jgi:hypothetical protein
LATHRCRTAPAPRTDRSARRQVREPVDFGIDRAEERADLAAGDALNGLAELADGISPFVLGFSDNGAATRFLIVMGVLELGATLMTRWDERDEFAVQHARSTRPGVA